MQRFLIHLLRVLVGQSILEEEDQRVELCEWALGGGLCVCVGGGSLREGINKYIIIFIDIPNLVFLVPMTTLLSLQRCL